MVPAFVKIKNMEKNKGGRPITHGFARRGQKRPREYNCWMHMIGRCTNPNHTRFNHYGAKGITVCHRWREFKNFIEDMGKAPSKSHSIDRYPNNKGNYEPGNVRWATVEQQNSNRTDNVFISLNGVSKTISQWSRHSGLSISTISGRLKRGLSSKMVLAR